MRKCNALKIAFWAVLFVFWSVSVFAQSVDTAWVRRYNGPGNGIDACSFLAIDDSGNVYVTGYSYGSGTDADYATIKYYPNGDTAWVRRYNGPGNGFDRAWAIGIDDSGNVYVTGESYDNGTDYDYATIKYYDNGDIAWVRRYNGPGDTVDCAYALTVDNSGNVYVTGRSFGSGTNYDYATIKYNLNGDTAWLRRYNGPASHVDLGVAIAVDESGNVYVTGESWGGDAVQMDYATLKYNSYGDTIWVRRYNGPGNSYDLVNSIAADSSGNVFLTGASFGSTTGSDYATIKYDRNGDTVWVRRYEGQSGYSHDYGYCIAIDNSGNVYVTGLSGGSGTWEDYATIKYYPNGDTAWVRRYNGPGNNDDRAQAIAVDNIGIVYVTGESNDSVTGLDYATIKYYPNGDSAWVKRYDGPNSDGDFGHDIAVDDSGNVYVTGASGGIGTGTDITTIKYIQFLCGDVNGDGKVTVTDVIYLINYLFKGGPPPIPLKAGDVNCDGKETVSDVVYLINYLFKGGLKPCQDCP
jgi:hypothetical protein